MKLFRTLLNRTYSREVIVLIAGLLTVLSFAPFHLFLFAYIGQAALLLCWLHTPSLRRTFWQGWLFGIGLFGFGIYWIYISIHTFGQAPAWLAILLSALLSAILAVFPGLTGLALNRFFRQNTAVKLLIAFPAIWVLLEWTRSWIFTGFPWLMLGYSHTDLPLAHYATLLSVFGVSLVISATTGALVYFYYAPKKQRILTVIYLVILWGATAFIPLIHSTKADGKPITVTLAQGNIAQSLKWQPEQVQSTLDTYTKLTQSHWNSDLIIWPEGAIPIPMFDAEEFLKKLRTEARAHHSALLTGISVENAFGTAYFNSILALGNAKGLYLKKHLVPFGEYAPLPKLITPILNLIKIPMSHFKPGQYHQSLIQFKQHLIATYICYEIGFPEEVRSGAIQANFIVSVSDDAWFGHSIAQAQHLQMAQMRSIETGKPLLFSTNDGITAIINAKGEITKQAAPYTKTTLTGQITPMKSETFWLRHGMDVLLYLCLALIIFSRWRSKKALSVTKKPDEN
jgi:apolipoprotein N-acyltransferase